MFPEEYLWPVKVSYDYVLPQGHKYEEFCDGTTALWMLGSFIVEKPLNFVFRMRWDDGQV
jgi:hypothetical protein